MRDLVAYTDDAPRVEVKQFLPNAFLVFDHLGAKTYNSLLVEMKNGELVLVDTPIGEKATASLLAWIDYKMGKRKIIAIITSHRWDRASGVGTLIQSGVPVYGSRETIALMKKVDQSMVAALLKVDDIRPMVPNHAFRLSRGLHLEFAGEKVDVIFPGKGYVDDNVVVHFPESKLVFAGALVTPSLRGDIKSWVGALLKVGRLNYEWLVPAEGRKLTPYLLEYAIKTLDPATQVARK